MNRRFLVGMDALFALTCFMAIMRLNIVSGAQEQENGAESQEDAPAAPAPPPAFQYAVTFICGKADGIILAEGAYFTAINIHNPTDRPIGFAKKFAIALPDEKVGPVSRFFHARLRPDEALEIDNADIFRHTQSNSDLIKGFAVIETNVELDVVAVYTAAGEGGKVTTLHIERVPPRRRGKAGQPDLVPPAG
jgi:hypothetical protein